MRNKIPGNWRGFIRDEGNKQELFQFLSPKISSFNYPEGKEVFATSDVNVLTKGSRHNMSPYGHEEADTRLLFHLVHVHVDALKNGCSLCIVRTVDNDAVVILIGKFHHLLSIKSFH